MHLRSPADTGSPGSLRLLTLGRSQAETGDPAEGNSVPVTGKPLALLVYLALAPQRTARREELRDLLWANVEMQRGRNSLRQMLWQLRQRLGESILTGSGEQVTVAPHVTTDRDAFLAAIQAGRLEEAVRLYQGPFLPDFAVPGGLGFEHWADGERARLCSAYQHALDSLARKRLTSGDTAGSVELARRLRDEDPGREASWRLLLEALAAAGNWLGVNLEIDAFERSLAAEAREAEPATRELLARVRQTPSPELTGPPRSPGLMAELVGRQREFATVLQAWREAERGQAGHVHLVAPAGLGKTRLLDDLRSRLRVLGATTASCRAHPGEGKVPWALASEMVEALASLPGSAGIPPEVASELVALHPALGNRYAVSPGPRPEREDPRRITLAAVELLRTVAGEKPVALLIDDLHWADNPSREVVQGLLARVEHTRALVVTTSRPEARGQIEVAATRRLDLPPLSEQDLDGLIDSLGARHGGGWSESLPAWLHRATDGSPLLALESLSLALDRGLLRLVDGSWECSDAGALERSLAAGSATRARLEELPDEARDILRLLAVAGVPLNASVIVAAIGCEPAAIQPLFSVLELQGLARMGPGGWETGHDRTRDELLSASSVEEVRGAHAALGRALGEALPRTSSSLRRAARHLLEAGDERALALVLGRRIDLARGDRDPRSAGALLEELLGEELDPHRRRRILRSLPLRQRVQRFRPVLALGAAGAGVALAAIAYGRDPSLALVVAPLATPPLTPAPVIELRGRTGARRLDAADTVRVEVVSGPGRLTGNTRVPAVEGRATFHELNLPDTGAYVLRFASEGYAPLVSDTIRVGAGGDKPGVQARLAGGTLNGRAIDPGDPAIQVRSGESISGTVDIEYLARWSAAAVFLCATPTWGDPATVGWTVTPLATPAEWVLRSAAVSVKAPPAPGRYHLIFAVQAERSCDYMLSATNWLMDQPVWHDGNDLAAWDSLRLAQARGRGWVTVPVLKPLPDGSRIHSDTPFGAVVIGVGVR